MSAGLPASTSGRGASATGPRHPTDEGSSSQGDGGPFRAPKRVDPFLALKERQNAPRQTPTSKAIQRVQTATAVAAKSTQLVTRVSTQAQTGARTGWVVANRAATGAREQARIAGATLRALGERIAGPSPQYTELTRLARHANYTALANRMLSAVPLPEADRAVVASVNVSSRTIHQAGSDMVREGERVRSPAFVASGWACRLRVLQGGRRQIIGFLLPGDGYGLRHHANAASPVTIAALTTVETVEAARLLELDSLDVAEGLQKMAAYEDHLTANHIMRLGLMDDTERMAHLLLELRYRLFVAGMATDNAFLLPIGLEHLAAALAMTPERTKRALGRLARLKLARIGSGGVMILGSSEEMAKMCEFRPPDLSGSNGVALVDASVDETI